MPGTNTCAFTAGGAKRVINSRKVVFHCDSTDGTSLRTYLTADTAGCADVARYAARGLRHAGDQCL